MPDIKVWRSDDAVMLRTEHGDIMLTHDEATELGYKLIGRKPRAAAIYRHWSEKDKEDFVEDYLGGMSIADMATKYGITKNLVSVMVSNMGLSNRKPKVPEREIRDHIIKRIKNNE